MEEEKVILVNINDEVIGTMPKMEAHEKAAKNGLKNSSDDCRLVLELGEKVTIVQGSEQNFKITSEFDLSVADSLLFKKSGTRESF